MSDSKADIVAEATVVADQASLNALATKIADSLSRGFSEVAQDLGKTISSMVADMTKKFADTSTTAKMKGVGKALEEGLDAATKAAGSASRAQKQLIEDADHLAKTLGALRKVKYVDPDLFELAAQNIRKLQRLSADIVKTDFTDSNAVSQINKQFETLRRTSIDSLKTINRVSDQAATEARQSFQRQTDAANAAAREKNTILRTSGEKEILLQRQQNKTVEAEAQKAKGLAIANRQALWASLLRIESAGIRGLEGAARTGVSAIGKVFDATFGNVAKTVTQKFETINRSTKTSLSQNEQITRTSLRRQEQLYSQSLSRTEATVTKFNKRVSTGLTGAVTGRGIGSGIGAIGGGIAFTKLIADGFNEAKNSIESANKAAVVFGGSFAGIEALGKDSAQALGLTNSQAVEAAATFGNLLRPLGVAEDQAAFFSAGLTQLGADLASFNNTSLEEALTAIRAGLVGENEPLRRFGVQINDAALKAKALELGLYNGKGTLDAYAKSQAAIALIYEQTSLAQGDFARTSGEVANQIKITGANLTNVFGALLKNVLPVVKVGLNGFNVVLDNLTKFINGDVSPALKVLREGLVGAAAGLGALLAAKAAVEVVQLLGVALKAAVSPVGLLVLAFSAAGAAIAILSKRSEGFRKFLDSAREAVGKAYDTIREFAIDGLGTLADYFDEKIVPALERFASFVVGTVVPAAIAIGKKIGELATGAAVRAVKFFDATLIPVFHKVVDVLGDLVTDGIDFALDAWERFGPTVIRVADQVVDGLGRVKEMVSGLSGGVLAGVGGAALVGTAILGPIGTLLAGGAGLLIATFRSEIVGGLATVGSSIVSFFEGIDWKGLALKALDFVETLGFILGNVVSDPRFLTAIAAIAAAAVVVGAKFIEGFAKGILENIPELASLGLTIAKTLLDAITSNLLLSAGLLAAALFGKRIVTTLIGAAKATGKDVATGFKVGFSKTLDNVLSPKEFAAGIKSSVAAAGKSLGAGGSLFDAFKASFRQAGANLGITTGQQIAVGITSALGSALAGQSLGKGDVVGGLGGIIASSLAAGAAGGPIVGAAVAGIGLVSAAWTSSSESAKKAAAQVRDFTDAIIANGDAGRDETFRKNFEGLGDSAVAALDKAGFSLSQLSAAAEGSRGAVDGVLAKLAASGDPTRSGALSVGTIKAMEFLNGQLKLADKGAEGAATRLSILGRDTDTAARSADAAASRYQGMADAIAASDLAAQKANLAGFVNDAKTAADDALLAFQNANAELLKFLNPEAGTIEETINRVIQSLPGLASQVQGGIDVGGALGQADIDTALAGLDVSIAEVVQKGLDDGLSTDQIKEKLAGLAIPISELDVTQDVKDTLLSDITNLLSSDQIEIVAKVKAESDAASARDAAAATVAKVAEVVAKFGPSLKPSGKALSDGVAKGISSGALVVANAATAIANAASAAFKKAMGIASPSKVFVGYGQNIGQGLVLGVDSFMPKVGDASTFLGKSVGEMAAEGIKNSKIEALDALDEFIGDLNDKIGGAKFQAIKDALAGGLTLDSARTSFGGDLKGILDAGQSVRDSMIEAYAAARKGEKAGPVGSFDITGLAGIENRQNFTSVVKNIKEMAETLFEAGTPIGEITAELQFMRKALLDTAGAAGFNRAEIEALVDSLGLSTGAIDSLATATANAQQKVTDAAAAEKAKADAAEQRQADLQAADEKQRELDKAASTIINNNIVVPYGDMEAIALAVSNRQQSEAARRIRTR